MSTAREQTDLEKTFDQLWSKVRSLDKILWSYSSSITDYPIARLSWLEEHVAELEQAHTRFIDKMRAHADQLRKDAN